MLFIFIVYVGSITLFTHRHIIDGQTVYHSHLYSGTDEQPSHTHSSQQFKTLQALTMYVALATSTPLLITIPPTKGFTLVASNTYCVTSQVLRLFSLRAPPAFM